MQIRAIRLRNVKKIGPDGLSIEDISPGLNVLSEPNEFGKSTIFEALYYGLLFKHSSKKEEIKNLRPNLSDAAPEIEVDLEHSEGSYRVFKRFLSRAETTITNLGDGRTIGGDDAQDRIKELLGIEGKAVGATGLLWVSQGESLNTPSQSADDQEVFSGVLDNEVSNLISGKTGRKIFERVEGELAKLLSLKTLKPMKAYKAEMQQLDELRDNYQELETEYRAAEKNLQDLNEIERQIRRWEKEDNLSQLQTELKTYQDKRDTLNRMDGDHRALKTARDLAEAEFTSAQRQLEDAREDIEKAIETTKTLEKHQTDLKDVLKLLSEKDAERQRNQKQLEIAEVSFQKDSHQLEKARSAGEIEKARQQLDVKSKDLKKAKEVQQEFLRLTADIEKLSIDNLVLREIEKADNEFATAKTLLSSSQVTAHIKYKSDKASGFTLTGNKPVEDGATLTVKDRLLLEMKDVVTIEIVNPLSSEGDTEERFSAAKRHQETLLSKYNVKTVSEARKLEKQRFELKQKRDDAEKQRLSFAPKGIDVLEEEISALTAQVSGQAEASMTVGQATEQFEKSQNEVTKLAASIKSIDEFLRPKISLKTALETKIDLLSSSAKELEEGLGPASGFEKRISDLGVKVANKKTALDKAKVDLDSFEKTMPNPESVQAGIDRVTKAIKNVSDTKQKLANDRLVLKERLSHRFNEGVEEELDNVRGEIEASEQKISAYENEAEALKLLRETLTESQKREKQKLFEPVIREIGPLARQVIPGIEFEFGEDFAASNIFRNGVKETIDSLSGGTQEQIAILTRLVFARLKAKQGYPTPVILDDALVFSDDFRISEMFDALNTVAKEVQILVLTCRQKSFQGLGGNVLTTNEWKN